MSSERERRERERIELLAAHLAAPGPDAASILLGIGDDAAVLDASSRGARLVWTVDAQVAGVHFRTDLASWQDIGWRSFMAAASDLAAMGATPWCALSALVLDPSVTDEALDSFARGQAEAAREVGAPVVGGNLSRGTETSITTTLLGGCDRPILRSAREGDGVWIAGDVGLAAAGLALLLANPVEGLMDTDAARAVHAWRRPRARIVDGLAMAGVAHGAIDVSDGLACDSSHLARASGLCVVFEEAALVTHVGAGLAALAPRVRRMPIDLALHGGEDYALVVASDAAIPGFTRIGRFDRGKAGSVFLESPSGTRPIDPGGWDHFR